MAIPRCCQARLGTLQLDSYAAEGASIETALCVKLRIDNVSYASCHPAASIHLTSTERSSPTLPGHPFENPC